ncbi:DNA/RNA non-specific endonuclease [Pontiella agarivorans]|nr:DNA/RNA non-specific endonuclease [Pontiella agarivorans]
MRVALMTALLYLLISVVYFHLPWSIRFPVYEKAPQLHRALMSAGFKAMNGWDSLALFGKDVEIPIPGNARGDWVYGGYPKQEGFKLIGRAKELHNRGYVVGYSEFLKNPLWVSYRLFDVPKLDSGRRPSGFKADLRTRAGVHHNDYTRSGYDRGHMAPNYGIATRYGPDAQKETFLMSNVIPQTPAVNQGIWRELEMLVAKKYGRYFSEVWIITGPVFQKPVEKLDSGVSIPSAYYKIVVDECDGAVRALAFLIEKDCPPYTRFRKRLVSIDEIETLTGLNFFPGLSEEEQIELETDAAGRLWPRIRPALRYQFKGKTN